MAVTETVETAAKAGKRDSKLVMEFLNETGETSTRVPEAVKAIKVKEAPTGKEYTYDMGNLPQSVLHQLAAVGMKRVMETHVRNGMDDEGTNILELAAEIYSTLAEGHIYTRGGGEGKAKTGPKFDFDFWTDVMMSWYKASKKAEPSDTERQMARQKLVAFTETERKEAITKWKKNPLFNAAFLHVKAQYAARKAVKAGAETNEEPDIF